MRYIIKKCVLLSVAMVLFGITGCKKYTDEYNPQSRTAETYYNTFAGFEDLGKSNYAPLRGIVNFTGLYYLGTDAFSTPSINDSNGENLYNNNLNSANGDVDAYFRQLYSAINIANNTLYWATQVKDGSAATVNTRVAEAKALRAYYYYLLTETFGDVPLVLDRTTVISLVFTRTPEKDVYTQIVKDLSEAIDVLPLTTPDFGRVTKGFAQHLLAKVYLTRGYKSYGGAQADFQLAATTAEAVINSGTYTLKAKYADLFDPTITNFQVNPEVIFSVQYSTNATTNGAGNSLQQYFMWDTQNTGLVGRSTFYGKTNNSTALDPYWFSVFDKARDSRYLANVYDVVYVKVAGSFNNVSYAVGDTLLYYPSVAFTPAQKAAKKYIVINPDEYRTSPFAAGLRSYPQFKKFRDPFVTAYVDNGGARDTYVFRLAETYLIAAEAYLKTGNSLKALQYFNTIRTRAANPGTNPDTGVSYATEMQVNTLTIDDILDERLRELTGEEFRWFELKRTGTLVRRTLAYNEEAKAANALKANNLLRPIPQAVIDLNRSTFPQNPGY
ncbi:RagB/SusD family nutrient uptake outer membrane protein [Mucilaginibacter flavus]|uniref:RagB/SusD family nutrient uptake outer membrane protein n=1 Tax=Mucilaginibacter flavus TaxID=931504 RepID=UPI0025B500AB|nr:RagB/SusD family nutrient uptake outer membrane protein [Mucilaginibacter flavus]MDN3580317.1 RagB/SusD family nutrient uptake outer membrane protein [Mucilaginibacter flavus]